VNAENAALSCVHKMSSVKVCGVVASCVLAVFITVAFLPTEVSSAVIASHYETYRMAVYRYHYRCYSYRYTYCHNWYYWRYWRYNWWWYGRNYYYHHYWNPYYGYYSWWPACYYRTYYSCYWRYYSTYVSRRRCQTRWSGTSCNVPSCKPACGGGQVCVDIDKCECASGGTSCSMVPCSPANNCYPGTCVSNACECQSGFSGPNCVKISVKPTITDCKVTLYAKANAGAPETALPEAVCAAEELEPKTVWVGRTLLDTSSRNLGLTKIEPVWRANYESPITMPSRPTGVTSFYISNAPVTIGVSKAAFTVIFPSLTTREFPCLSESTAVDPLTSKHCDIATSWNNLGLNPLLVNNVSFVVNITASLGGTKKGDSTYTYKSQNYGFLPQQYVGTPITVQAKFQIDLEPPTHCLLESNDHSNCTVFPISLDQDIRTNPVIEPKFLGWTDDESGVDRYHVEVFLLKSGVDDTLQPIGNALISAETTPDLNNFQFTSPEPGVYAIVLTAYDQANNSAKARKIYNFNDQPSFTTTGAPAFVQEADASSNYSYITTIHNRNQLTLKWPGRFKTDDIYNELLLLRVKPLAIDSNTIDDKFGTKFGMRSINAVRNLTGIDSIVYRYVVDKDGGGLGVEEPNDNETWPSVGKTAESAILNFTERLENGDTVVVWLKVVDLTGNPSIAVIKAFVDASPVEVANYTFATRSPDQFTSTITITAFDRESGIKGINYEIYDERTDVSVHKEFVPPTRRDPPSIKRKRAISQPCLADDTTCYCTPMRQCYNYQQVVEIDHCNIDRYTGDGHRLVFKYAVVSNTEVPVPNPELKHDFEFGDISELSCRPTPITESESESKLSGGAIAGIVIGSIFGFLLLLCLIIIIILIIVRISQHKTAIPDRKDMRTYAHNVRNRFTMRHDRAADNDMYVGAGPPPSYPGPSRGRHNKSMAADGDLYVDGAEMAAGAQKIDRKQVQMGDTIAEGRFAVVRKATLEKGTAREQVAAKALKRGFSKSDEVLMVRKIAFLRDLTAHGNIVRFVGSVDDAVDEGPIMLLELCEISLKDWLASLRSVSTDDLEIMLVFTLDIARGVEHLHANKIIHRRLAVRNVLLKQVASGLAAKLIGFGPSNDDADNKTGAGSSSVPIKWMAPETLDSINSRKPTYNEKTDAWSYGITIWEMYSKGALPYPDVKSADVRGMIKHGHRLTCPRECPPELFSRVLQPCWSDSAKQRPAFGEICRKVDEFRSGSERPQEGYYDSEQGQYQSRPADQQEAMYADGM
jgi:hypothetical protein